MIYAFSCHFNFFNAMGTVKSPSPGVTLAVQSGVVALALVTYLSIVSSVLLLHARETQPDFLLNLPPDDGPYAVAKLAFLLVLLAAYPLNCRPCSSALLEQLGPFGQSTAARWIATCGLVLLSMTLAIACPDIAVALSLIGGTATSSMLYIYPAAFFLSSTADDSAAAAPGVRLRHARAHRAACWLLFALGAFAWVCTGLSLVSQPEPADDGRRRPRRV
jgi:amino acid permease